MSCVPGQEPERSLADALAAKGITAHVIGGADVAAELDAKRAIDQGHAPRRNTLKPELMPGRLILYTKKLPEMVAFYCDHFGYRVDDDPADRLVELVPPTGAITLLLHPAAKSQKTGQVVVKLVFDIRDVAAMRESLKQAGIAVGPAPRCRRVSIRQSEGSLWQRREPFQPGLPSRMTRPQIPARSQRWRTSGPTCSVEISRKRTASFSRPRPSAPIPGRPSAPIAIPAVKPTR